MPGRDLVVFGDSVPWGQGLQDGHKFSTIVKKALNLAPLVIVAHSGARIGARDTKRTKPIDGEVPVPEPTILQQIEGYAGDPQAAALIIVNGGINDVTVERILNPATDLDDLHDKTVRHCQRDMITVLESVITKFPSNRIQIAVTSYFPILSSLSEPELVPNLLAVHGLDFSPLASEEGVFNKIVAQCQQFWRDSSAALVAAITQVGDQRIRFAQPPFTDRNAVFAPDAWLFGLKGLHPEDEVIAERYRSCDLKHPIDMFKRWTCHRASVGHPNVPGAGQFASAILSGLLGKPGLRRRGTKATHGHAGKSSN
jgi:hypothetical protein